MRPVPVSGALGAEIQGVDLRSPDEKMLSEIRDALHRHEVISIRGAHLTAEEHMRLAEMLGQVNIFPTSQLLGATEPAFQTISDGPGSPPEADTWHTDVTWTAAPPSTRCCTARSSLNVARTPSGPR